MKEVRRDKKGRLLKTGEIQRKDDKYQYSYKDITGKRQSVYSWRLVPTDKTPKGKKDDLSLREKEQTIRRDLEDGIKTNNKMTLNVAFQTHMAIQNYANSTYNNYIYLWEKYISHSQIAKANINKVKKSHILKFYKELSNRGLSDGTIRIFHNMIYCAFEVASNDDVIINNPSSGCVKEYSKRTNKRKALSLKEQQLFLEAVNNSPKCKGKYKLLFRIMIGLACRISEIVGLTWNDVDMSKRIVSIDHEILYKKKDEKYQFYASSPKTSNGVRVIPMTDEVYDCFIKLRENRFTHLSSVCIDGYTDFIFVSGHGKPLYHTSVNNALDRIVKRYNMKADEEQLPHISNHIFRHTGCTRMAEAEVDPNTLQYIMGHGSYQTISKVYDHVSIERAKTQIDKVNKKNKEVVLA